MLLALRVSVIVVSRAWHYCSTLWRRFANGGFPRRLPSCFVCRELSNVFSSIALLFLSRSSRKSGGGVAVIVNYSSNYRRLYQHYVVS